jgi:hypothetical protein
MHTIVLEILCFQIVRDEFPQCASSSRIRCSATIYLTSRLIRSVLVLAAIFCATGCTYTVHRPLAKLHKIMLDWSNQKYDDSTGHMVELVKLPGATYLYSTNETLGVGAYGRPHLLPAFKFNVPAAHQHSLTVAFLTDGLRCRVSPPTYEAMAVATRGALSRIDSRYVPIGSVDIILNRDGPYFVDQIYAIRLGRSIKLMLYFPCEDGVEDAANISSLLTSLHELTHIIYRLHSGIPGSPEEEISADDAPACVYEDLRGSSAAEMLWSEFPPDAYYHDIYYGPDKAHPQTAFACERWVRTIQAFAR